MNPAGPTNRRIGLHTRLSLGVAAVVLAATFAIATIALQLVKTSMQASIASEQFARVSTIAEAVDQKFVSRRILLKTFAESVRSQGFPNAAPLQAFLEKHEALRGAFDNVAFLDLDGNLVANLNGARQIGRVNVKDRAYFQDTVASNAGVISQPYRNRLNGLAQVAITEPVLDGAGKAQFVISGSINLKERNILGDLADVKFGETGYLFITSTDGIVVDHPIEARILNRADAHGGGNPEADHAIAALRGNGRGAQPRRRAGPLRLQAHSSDPLDPGFHVSAQRGLCAHRCHRAHGLGRGARAGLDGGRHRTGRRAAPVEAAHPIAPAHAGRASRTRRSRRGTHVPSRRDRRPVANLR